MACFLSRFDEDFYFVDYNCGGRSFGVAFGECDGQVVIAAFDERIRERKPACGKDGFFRECAKFDPSALRGTGYVSAVFFPCRIYGCDAIRGCGASDGFVGDGTAVEAYVQFIVRGQAESPKEEGRAMRVLQVFEELKAKFTRGTLFVAR